MGKVVDLQLVVGCILSLLGNAAAERGTGDKAYTPVAYQLGNAPSLDGLQPWPAGPLTLSPSDHSVLTLDYGAEVGGFPFLDISSASGGAVQVLLKYSEPFNGLALPYSDGPLYADSGIN